jgi:hypothetical protein
MTLPVNAHSQHECKKWIGARSIPELCDKVDNGWPEMEEIMNHMLAGIDPPPSEIRPEVNRRRKRVRAAFGNELDIHAVNQGRMDRAWDATRVIELETVGNKLVHIVVNMSASASVAVEAGLWRGAAVMRIFDVLQRMGKSVAISGDFASRGMFDIVGGMASIRLKAYGEPLRSDRLAAAVTLGFGRSFLLRKAVDSHPTRKAVFGRGQTVDDYSLWTQAAEQDKANGGAVVVIGQCFNKSQAQQVVDKFIAQYSTDKKVQGLADYEIHKTFSSKETPHYE